ncbi:MAG: hypothetical protein WBG08_10640 [Litorimonas sp.]|uniref:Uncharacterized protein n=1 Tax=Algimonas ampicilliniresistens TaxID=1298735 RepID=A0ABQ5VB90_9PROT|nr:hypothetical protein [Algimonas ampicilliniresistens]GLQ23856.1 hypothetical protein GCM10007853_17300 [Algimonas ampicilliniresistens]
MTPDQNDILKRLDMIAETLAVSARRQETISKVLELLVVHIPDTTPTIPANDKACLCQITFSDLSAGG